MYYSGYYSGVAAAAPLEVRLSLVYFLTANFSKRSKIHMPTLSALKTAVLHQGPG